MNNAQRKITSVFCFILGGALIFGAGLEEEVLSLGLLDIFWSIKFYLGIISIGAGLFFLKGGKRG